MRLKFFNFFFSPEVFSEQICLDLKLPFEFKNLISLKIRKQIKDYVFLFFNKLSLLYPNVSLIKENTFLDSVLNDPRSLKGFLNGIKQAISPIKKEIVVKNPISNENKQKIESYNYLNRKIKRGKIGRYYKNDIKRNAHTNKELIYKYDNDNDNEDFHIKSEENSKVDNYNIINRSRRKIKNKYINNSINISLNEEVDDNEKEYKDNDIIINIETKENKLASQKYSRKKNRNNNNNKSLRIKSKSKSNNMKKRRTNNKIKYEKGKTNKYIIYFNPYSILIDKKLFQNDINNNEDQNLPDEYRYIIIEKSKLDIDFINS